MIPTAATVTVTVTVAVTAMMTAAMMIAIGVKVATAAASGHSLNAVCLLARACDIAPKLLLIRQWPALSST